MRRLWSGGSGVIMFATTMVVVTALVVLELRQAGSVFVDYDHFYCYAGSNSTNPSSLATRRLLVATTAATRERNLNHKAASASLTLDWNFNRQGVLTTTAAAAAAAISTTGKNNAQQQSSSSWATSAQVHYQCTGPEYQRLGRLLQKHAAHLVETGQKPPTWGHRAQPLPSNARILMFGNSHLRQVALSLVGQFVSNSNTSSITEIHQYGMQTGSQIMAQRYTIGGLNITIYVVTNSYVAHCPHPYWKDALEQQIGVSLDSMDAVVMSVLNPYDAKYRHLEYYTNIADKLKRYVPAEYNCRVEHLTPPSLGELLGVFPDNRPVVYLTMFSDHNQGVVQRARAAYQQQAQKQKRRQGAQNTTTVSSPVLFLRVRDYIDNVHHEGAVGHLARQRHLPSHCIAKKAMGKLKHRCVGKSGGYPDLVAWDVSEFLFENLAG